MKVLQNLTQIVESSLRSLSDALVREETIKLNRKDLTDIIDDAKNNNKGRGTTKSLNYRIKMGISESG